MDKIGGFDSSRLVRNAQHVGRQSEGVRRNEMKSGNDEAEINAQRDTVSLSEQIKRGEKAGETTGMSGRSGAKELGLDRKIEDTHKENDSYIGGRDKEKEGKEGEGTPSSESKGGSLVPFDPEKHLPMVIEEKKGDLIPVDKNLPMVIDAKTGEVVPYKPGEMMLSPGSTPQPVISENMPRLQGAGGGQQPPGGGPPPPPGGQIPLGGQTPPPQGPSSTPYTDAANKAKEIQDDMLKAQTIYAEMAAARQKWLMQLWQIIQDTQTAIMQMMQDAALRRAKVMDACAAKWAACLGGYLQ